MENKDQENKKENKYYSYKLMFDTVEDVNIDSIVIPDTMLDSSNDVLESDSSKENLIDYDEFEDSEEDLEALGFEGKTEAELQDFIMKKLMGEMTDQPDIATAKTDENDIPQNTDEEETPQESDSSEQISEVEIENTEKEKEKENTLDIEEVADENPNGQDNNKEETQPEIQNEETIAEVKPEKININKINIEDASNITQAVPESMFQISEEETERQLKEVENTAIQNQEPEETENKTDVQETYEDPFDKFAKENSDKKKFVFTLDQNQADIIDKIELKNRDNYIKHAIELKIKFDSNTEEKENRKTFITKVIIIALTIIIGLPIVYKTINWSIDSTLKNYEYCQKSFEKLFKEKYHFNENLK